MPSRLLWLKCCVQSGWRTAIFSASAWLSPVASEAWQWLAGTQPCPWRGSGERVTTPVAGGRAKKV